MVNTFHQKSSFHSVMKTNRKTNFYIMIHEKIKKNNMTHLKTGAWYIFTYFTDHLSAGQRHSLVVSCFFFFNGTVRLKQALV